MSERQPLSSSIDCLVSFQLLLAAVQAVPALQTWGDLLLRHMYVQKHGWPKEGHTSLLTGAVSPALLVSALLAKMGLRTLGMEEHVLVQSCYSPDTLSLALL